MSPLPRNQTKILVRATNWVGDAVMSLPAIRAVRDALPAAHLTVLARPAVADLYARESAIDSVTIYSGGRRQTADALRRESFDCALLLPNSFDAALLAWMARIPRRIGYNRDARRWLLTEAIPPPESGEIPRHQRFYYLELLRRAGMIHEYPPCVDIRLDGRDAARAAGRAVLLGAGMTEPVVGVSPGAAYGDAKRWLPERFAEAAVAVARTRNASVALFGSAAEQPLCESIAGTIRAAGVPVRNFAGETTLRQFIDLTARVQPVSHQRLRRHAHRVGVGRSHGHGIRRHRRNHHRTHGRLGAHRPRTGGVQPVPAAGVPHRPSLHDARDGRSRGGGGAPALGGNG